MITDSIEYFPISLRMKLKLIIFSFNLKKMPKTRKDSLFVKTIKFHLKSNRNSLFRYVNQCSKGHFERNWRVDAVTKAIRFAAIQ